VSYRQSSQPETIQAPSTLDLPEYGRHDRLAREECPGYFAVARGACLAGLVLCARRVSRGRAAPPSAAGRAADPMNGPCVESFPHAVVRQTRTAQACLVEGPRKSPGRAGICQLPPAQPPLRVPQRRTTTTQIQGPAVGAAGSPPGRRPARLPGPDHLAGRHSLKRAGGTPH